MVIQAKVLKFLWRRIMIKIKSRIYGRKLPQIHKEENIKEGVVCAGAAVWEGCEVTVLCRMAMQLWYCGKGCIEWLCSCCVEVLC